MEEPSLPPSFDSAAAVPIGNVRVIRKQKEEGEEEGLLSVVPFLVFPLLALLPCCPDGARVNTSGGPSGRPSVKSVSQQEREGRTEGSLIVFCLPLPPSLAPSLPPLPPTYFLLYRERHLLFSLSPSVRNRISQKEDKRRCRRRLHFFSGGHWLPSFLPSFPPPPFLLSSLGFIYWLG